jgi:DNA polymerase III delta subunit
MLKPIYALIGEDGFLLTEKLLSMLRQLPGDAHRVEVDGQQAELADVLDELRSFALFGSGKIVIVRDGDDFISRFREQLEKYLANPSTSATLVLRLSSLPANQRIYKLIDKLGGIQRCQVPKDLVPWIIQQGRTAHQLTLSVNVARLLAELVGADLGRLDNELSKLALQSDNGKIDMSDIAGTVAFQREQEMWDMTNELADGKTTEALRRWRQLVQMDASAEFRAVTWLTMWLEKVGKALAMKNQGMRLADIAQQLKIWPAHRQEPFMRTAQAMGQTGVVRALNLLAQIDHQSKTGVGDALRNVERFILAVNLNN